MRATKRTHETRHVTKPRPTTVGPVRANGRPNRPSLTLEPRQVPFEKPQLQRTTSVWPLSVRRHAPDSASQTSVAYPLFATLSAKLKPHDTNFALIILPGQVSLIVGRTPLRNDSIHQHQLPPGLCIISTLAEASVATK